NSTDPNPNNRTHQHYSPGDNPIVSKIPASSDAGHTLTTPVTVNDNADPLTEKGTPNIVNNSTAPERESIFSVSGYEAASPRISISQGTAPVGTNAPRVDGGQVNVVYSTFGRGDPNAIRSARFPVDMVPNDGISNDNRPVGAEIGMNHNT